MRSSPVPAAMTEHATAHGVPLFVVSPHLDDAVFGCGTWLAERPGSTICTVCCAIPPVAIRTQWDTGAGFRDSTEAMRTRLREDSDALAMLHANAVRLMFFDHQYGQPASVREVADALAGELLQRRDTRFVMPLGLVHPDHVLVGDACLGAFHALQLERCIVYEESPYRALSGTVHARLVEIAARHPDLELTRFDPPELTHTTAAGEAQQQRRKLKHAAAHAYRSQLPALAHLPLADLEAPERYWVLTRR